MTWRQVSAANTSEAVSAPRRVPSQQRSRERLERILGAASMLIADKGSDLMKMSEVADLAEISIGSLYQYFPDKGSIIRALAENYNAASRKCIRDALVNVRDADGLRKAYSALLDQYYNMFLAEPVMRDIWSGMQADKKLLAIELIESRANSALLAEAMIRVYPDANRMKITSSAFLIWHLGEATMRLAISLDRKESDALVSAFKHMTLHELQAH